MSTANPDKAANAILRFRPILSCIRAPSGAFRDQAGMISSKVGDYVLYDDHARMTTDLRQLLGQARGLLAEGDTDRADKMLIVALGVLDGEEG